MTSTIAHSLDGSLCEGGGQILRNAVALSALLSKPISIQNVRHNRRPPGLRKQHEAGINLAAAICSAETEGVHLASTNITFKPRKLELPKTLTADPGTAGSTTLLLQVSLPCLLFASSPTSPSQLTLRGGTNAAQAPQVDYTQHVFLPFMKRHFGLDIALNVTRRGYFPKGGGVVFCCVPSVTEALPPVTLTERGPVQLVKGEARVGGLPFVLAERMKDAARATLLAAGVSPTAIRINAVREAQQEAFGSGGGILLLAETGNGCVIGGSSVSTKNKTPEEVGNEAAEELLRNLRHDGCVDEYLQDQIIIFIALAKGHSTIKTGPLTDHTRTAIKIAEQMTGATFHLEENSSGFAIISCDGIGYTPSL